MNFKQTNSTLTNLQRSEVITLYDIIGLFQDICEDLENEEDKTLDELDLGDSKKVVGRLLWVGQEITNALKSNKSMLIDPGRAVKIEKQRSKLQEEVSALEQSEQEVKEWTEQERKLTKIQERRRTADQQKERLIEVCTRMEEENNRNESVTIPELQKRKAELEQTRCELKDACAAHTEENAKLKMENDILQNKLKKEEAEYSKLKYQAEAEERRVKDAEITRKNLSSKLAGLKAQQELLDEDCERIKSEKNTYELISIPELEARKKELEKKKIELGEVLALLRSQVSELTNDNYEIQKNLDDAESERDRLKTLCDEKTSKVRSLEADKVSREGKLFSLNSRIESLEKECRRLEYENAQYENVTIPESEAKVEKQKKKNEDLSNQCTQKSKEESSLKNDYDSLSTSLRQTEDSCNDLKKKIAVNTTELQQLQKEKAEKQADLDILKDKLEYLGAEEKNIIRQINELESNMGDLNIEILRNRYKGKSEECQKLQAEHKSLTEKECELNIRNTNLNNDILTINSNIQTKRQIITELTEKKENQQIDFESCSKQVKELEKWFDSVECKDCMERIKKLRRRIDELQSVQKALFQDLDDDLYLTDNSAIEGAEMLRDHFEKTLRDHEDGIRELQTRYTKVVEIIYDKGEDFL